MTPLIATGRIRPTPGTSATDGQIRWAPLKTLWLLSHGTLGAIAIL